LMIAVTAEAGVLKVRFNDMELGIDQDTGSVMFLSSPATGLILEAVPESAGLIDLAYPLESFAAMRLASRFSKASVVQKGPGEVLIEWDKLGASRANLALPSGVVSAYVTIRAANDGKSVILACRVENKSSAPIPQELFPDL